MAIRSFDEYALHESKYKCFITGTSMGSETGAFYKLKTTDISVNSLELFYIKNMSDESIVNEYIAGNIAHLLLEERAPSIDLAISFDGQNRVVHTVSRVLKGFKNLDQLTASFGASPDHFLQGFVIDKEGKLQPHYKYSSSELEARKDLKVIPYLKKMEDVIVVAEYLNHLDMCSKNIGAIVLGVFMTAALIDFNRSLKYESYKIGYNPETTNYCNINTLTIANYQNANFIAIIDKLISKDQEIMVLVDRLSSDLLQLNLPHDSATLKFHLREKLDAFKSELVWLHLAELLEEPSWCEDQTELFVGLQNSNMSLVSDHVIERVLDQAVKKDVLTILVVHYPRVTSYRNYDLVEIKARVKYKSPASYEASLSVIATKNIASVLSVAIEYKKQNVVAYITSLPLANKDFGVAFESAVQFADKSTFDALFVKIGDTIKSKSSMEKSGVLYRVLERAFVESVVSDRPEFFDFIFPYIINKYYAPPNCDYATKHSVVMALTESIRGNKCYYFTKLLSICAEGTLNSIVKLIAFYNRIELVKQANPQMLQLLHSYGVKLDEDKVSITVDHEEPVSNTILIEDLQSSITIGLV